MYASNLLLTMAVLAVLIIVCLLPLFVDGAEDQGDGRTFVRIPGYVRTPPHRPRTWAFGAISAVAGLLFLGWKHPAPSGLYVAAVRAVAVAITRDPATVNGYVLRLRPALALFAVAYIVAMALVVRAGLGRRVAILGHAVLYLALSILAQALMIVVGVGTGWVVGPFGIEATLVNLLIGGLIIMRMTFTTFVLPRATTVPRLRRSWLRENILTWSALISVIALLVGAYAYISQQANLGSAWQVFLPLYAVSLLFVLMFVPLWLVWWLNPRCRSPAARTGRRWTSSSRPTTRRRTSPACSSRLTWPQPGTAARSGSWCPTTARWTARPRWPEPRSPASSTPAARCSTRRTVARPRR